MIESVVGGSSGVSVGDPVVPTGIDGFDDLVEGGFPRDGLIVVSGAPGTGKTTLAAEFLCTGVNKLDEPGVYVSLAEDEATFARNTSRHLGRRCEECLSERRCRFLDLITVKEAGVSGILEMILKEVKGSKARRLVIDSYSALAQAFKEPIDGRIVVHTLLGKVVRSLGCTTILVSESSGGREEFVADGVIRLRRGRLDGRLLRDLEIVKMRGRRLGEQEGVFSLEDGFRVARRFKERRVEEPKRFRPVEDPPGMFSSGIPEIDRILDGGYPRGATVLFEVGMNVPVYGYHLLTAPTAWNFLANGRPVADVPSAGVDAKMAFQRLTDGGFGEDEVNRLFRICEFRGDSADDAARPPYVWTFETDDVWRALEEYHNMMLELKRSTGQPILSAAGSGAMYTHLGEKDLNKIVNTEMSRARREGDLGFLILKPGIPDPSVYDMLRVTADLHFKVARQHGVLLFYGVRPRTGLYTVETDVGRGYPMPRLTPIV